MADQINDWGDPTGKIWNYEVQIQKKKKAGDRDEALPKPDI